MPLIYLRTSIFDSPAQTLVNTVNCVGVMGKGLAKEFKSREPLMFRSYKALCDEKKLRPGLLWLWRGKSSWVLNFPTKQHWRSPSRLEWIEAGLEKFASRYQDLQIEDISFPRLGCGNGDLNWEDVRPLMERYLSDISIPVYIHDFSKDIGLPEHLEHVAEQMRSEAWTAASFDKFLAALERSLDISEGKCYSLQSGEPFKAVVADRRLGLIRDDGCSWLEEEDLRGIWLGLQSGLVTSKKAGWSVRGTGDQVLSLMSVLPYVKPVEIQRSTGDPEIALERKFGLPTLINSTKTVATQEEMKWH